MKIIFGGVILLAVVSSGSPAHAIARTFVSGTGGGAACTRAAPCATFQAAHDATDSGGEVNCVDGGDFGAVTVAKSITFDCLGIAGATASNFTVNAADLVVRLRGLIIRNTVSGADGVFSTLPGTFHIEYCTVSSTGSAGHGLDFVPNGGAFRL